MRFVEVCSGLGGLRLGLEGLGWRCLQAIDSDRDTSTAHEQMFGQCETADVRNLSPDSVARHDVLVAGFPCQPFSSSGHRSGINHPAGGVFDGILRILDYHQPRFTILENVQGLLSNKYGHTFASVLKALTDRDYT